MRCVCARKDNCHSTSHPPPPALSRSNNYMADIKMAVRFGGLAILCTGGCNSILIQENKLFKRDLYLFSAWNVSPIIQNSFNLWITLYSPYMYHILSCLVPAPPRLGIQFAAHNLRNDLRPDILFLKHDSSMQPCMLFLHDGTGYGLCCLAHRELAWLFREPLAGLD